MIFDVAAAYQAIFGINRFEAEVPQQAQSSKLNASPFYATDKGRDYFFPVKLGNTQLPLPLIRIQGRLSIVETLMVNRDGSVKEMISTDDFRIMVRGLCVGTNNQWPEDEIMELQKLYAQKKSLSISCPLTDIFLLKPDRQGSDKVVINDLEILETRGFKNVVGYRMELTSDNPFSLIIE